MAAAIIKAQSRLHTGRHFVEREGGQFGGGGVDLLKHVGFDKTNQIRLNDELTPLSLHGGV